MIRPYRLINSSEMNALTKHLAQVIQAWNEEFALTPLCFGLTIPSKEYSANQNIPIHADQAIIASMDKHYLGLFNRVLFGEEDPCFNPVSHQLLIILLQRILKLEQCMLKETSESTLDWFYQGSTCLLLTLNISPIDPANKTEKLNENQLRIIFSPEWVTQSLTHLVHKKNNLDSLDDALGKRMVDLSLELSPLNLPVNQLINIQIGDVLVSDHPITTPLKLLQNEQLIAESDLGQTVCHKSIVLKRSL